MINNIACAQDTSQSERFSKHSISFEILGRSYLYYSIIYDRIFLNREKIKVSGNVGLGIWPERWEVNQNQIEYEPFYAFSLGASAFYGKTNHRLETGLGLSLINDYYLSNIINDFRMGNELLIWFFFGYRYSKPSGGIVFRIGQMPLYDLLDFDLEYNIAISIGYAFKNKSKVK